MACEPEYNYDGTILNRLPEEYDGMFEVPEGVTEIADSAFMDCQSLSAISLPSTLTKIGDYAFKRCESLQEITIPDSVTEIGQAAFWMCHSLTDVVLSRSLCEIDDEAFCETAIEHIVIPESVRSIGERAFEDCYNLYDVVLPENIRIADSAFKGCVGLHSADALYLNLYNNPHYKLIQVFPHAKGYKIPDDVVEIGSGAFENSGIVHLEVPGSIKVIHNSAFSGIPSLKSIKICNGVTSLPDCCFHNCESLEEVSVPESIDTIGSLCFAGCTNLEEIVLPDKPTEISESLFEGCGSLKSVTIGRNIIKVGSKAFMNCTALKEILMPDSLEKISYRAFAGCTSLKEILMPDSVRSLEDECFEGCSSLKRINFSDSLEIIPYRAFASCTELETITLPKNLNKIEDKAFLGCSSLKEVINSGSASVYQDSFRGTLVKDARLLPEFKYYGRMLPSEWKSETVSGDTLLTVYRGFYVKDVETANAIIDDIKKNGLYLEQITEKFPKEYSYKSSVGHKKFSETELDELYANKIPVDYALQGADNNQVYFGDYHCAMYYATRGSRSSVAILIEAKMSLNELNVDGTDSLNHVFDPENNNPLLRTVFGKKIDLYLEKLRAETTNTDKDYTNKIRWVILNMAQSDNDIVYAFYNNDLLIHGTAGTEFKYALKANLPIAPERIVSVKIVQDDSSSFTDSSRTITLCDLRR